MRNVSVGPPSVAASTGPITRSHRDQVRPMSEEANLEPNPNRVLVSEPLDRNLEAASTFSNLFIIYH